MTPIKQISQPLLAWYELHGRKSLPWHHNVNAYRVWVSEIMLQQTQVVTVLPYYQRFMAAFPDIHALADAPQDSVLHHWSGLGYYARARNLHKAAQIIRDNHAGKFPTDFDQVVALPGIGRSTAGAVLAFSTDQRHSILDGNVKRVLCRYHAVDGWPGKAAITKQLWELAERHTPQQRVAEYTQAIMDLGATCCTRSKPDCPRCPLRVDCQAYIQDTIKQYPTPKPRKTIPVHQANLLLLFNAGNEVLLQRRPPAGIWGGLWSFPELPVNSSLKAWCQESYGLCVELLEEGSIIRHTFSHFHLDIQPHYLRVVPGGDRIMESNEIVWYNTQIPDQRGLPAPIQRMIEQIPSINCLRERSI